MLEVGTPTTAHADEDVSGTDDGALVALSSACCSIDGGGDDGGGANDARRGHRCRDSIVGSLYCWLGGDGGGGDNDGDDNDAHR